jgi:CDP-glycerol glycerophosphotransferase
MFDAMHRATVDYDALISIVIPVYNGEKYIGQCIDSVLAQTYENFEVIVVDDGSHDETPTLLSLYAAKDERIKVTTVDNGGQGRARNIGMAQAVGAYLFFLDADDTIERTCLKTCVERISDDRSDYVVFSFKYIEGGSQRFTNVESYFGDRMLDSRDAINALLDCKAYFSVTRLYDAAFIKDNGIQFAEGHIYEDNRFIVETVLLAQRVSVVYAPLYSVRLNSQSSTKTNTDSRKHCDDYLAAIRECVDCLLEHGKGEGAQSARYYYARYATRRYLAYYYRRVPRRYRSYFSSRFVEEIGRLGSLSIMLDHDKLLSYCMRHEVFAKKKTRTFRMLTHYMVKTRRMKKNLSARVARVRPRIGMKATSSSESAAIQGIASNKTVLFMGFDHRYAGSSRYLFESMIAFPQAGIRYLFATDSELVDETYRLAPDSDEFCSEFARAKAIIFEGWIPQQYQKNAGQYWIQLGHGPSLKRMLFDFQEKAPFVDDPSKRIRRYADIQTWDYLVAESELTARSFETSLLLPPSRIVLTRSPRTRFLTENGANGALKEALRGKHGLSGDEKTILYAPAWRDYNYGLKDSDQDHRYLLDCEELQERLGCGFHVMAKSSTSDTGLSADAEMQELLMVADVVVTDYSSIMFDAMAMGKPIALFVNDFERFDASRGVYPHMWKHLERLVVDNVVDLVEVVRTMGDAEANVAARDFFKSDAVMSFGVEHTVLRLASGKARAPRVIVVIDRNESIAKIAHEASSNIPYGFQVSDCLLVRVGSACGEGDDNDDVRALSRDFTCMTVGDEAELKHLEDELLPLMMVFVSDEGLRTYNEMYPDVRRDTCLLRR